MILDVRRTLCDNKMSNCTIRKLFSALLVVLNVCQVSYTQLIVSEPDISLLYTEHVSFNISLNTPIETSGSKLLLQVNHDKVLSLSATVLPVPRNVEQTWWNVTINGKHPGNAIINITLDPAEQGIRDAFIHVGVEKDIRLSYASDIIGWIYFSAWTISFYPQMFTNYKKKSVIGLNFDFLGLNLIGFALYSLYNVGLYSFEFIQDEFFDRNPTNANPVQLNDVFFSIHATCATLVVICQCFIYERGTQKVSIGARVLMASFFVFLSVIGVLVFFHVANLKWLDFLNNCSHVKLTITLVKYIPQAFMNFQRKSTSGWSIGNVLLDFVGGVFSLLQMIILAINFDDWDGLLIDTTKLGLGLFSVSFDILFIIQHYVLYREGSGVYDLNGSV